MSERDGSGAPQPGIDDETLDLYVLGALDPDERARVAAAVESSTDLARRAAQTEEVLAMIGSATPATPPPSMRAAVLGALGDVPQERPEPDLTAERPDVPSRGVAPEHADPTDELAARRARRARRDAPTQAPTRRSALRYAVAAAAVVVAGAGGYAAWSAAKGEEQDAVASARERIDAAPDAQVVPARGASGPWARTELRWSASVGEAVIFSPDPLPSASASGGVYQVWRSVDAEDAPSPVVDFDADGRGGSGGVVVPGGAAAAAVIAVSRESGPGATRPTTPLVATYPLST